MNTSPSQLTKHYGACPKKIASRQQTIINIYRNRYNLQSIPEDKQYWTICGRCSYEYGKLEEHCEPDQIISSGLVKPNQFHGIEISQEIYDWNAKANKDINWHLGDFYETMVEYSNHNYFNPAIINADMLLMPKNGAQYLSKILSFIDTKVKDVMVVANYVAECRHLRSNMDDIVSNIEKEPSFQLAFNNGNWSIHDEYYWYNGTGKTSTKMITVIFFKQ